MKKPVLFIQGGGQGAHETDRELVVYLQDALGAEYDVLYPKMLNLENPEYEPWKIQARKELAI